MLHYLQSSNVLQWPPNFGSSIRIYKTGHISMPEDPHAGHLYQGLHSSAYPIQIYMYMTSTIKFIFAASNTLYTAVAVSHWASSKLHYHNLHYFCLIHWQKFPAQPLALMPCPSRPYPKSCFQGLPLSLKVAMQSWAKWRLALIKNTLMMQK